MLTLSCPRDESGGDPYNQPDKIELFVSTDEGRDCAEISDGKYAARQFEPTPWGEYRLNLYHGKKLYEYNDEEGYPQFLTYSVNEASELVSVLNESTLVVSIAARGCNCASQGGCDSNCPQYGWGIYFGPSSKHNKYRIIGDTYERHPMAALLECLRETIYDVGYLCKGPDTPCTVRVQTDDEDLVNDLARSEKASGSYTIDYMQEQIDEVSSIWAAEEKVRRMKVQLWHVDEVPGAAELAHSALLTRRR